MLSLSETNYTPPMAYLPNPVTQVPKPTLEYACYQITAPLEALEPMRKDGKEANEMKDERRHRTRYQVGDTNRWRSPRALLSDLLGVSQANRSLQYKSTLPFNKSYIKFATADSPHRTLNDDSEVNRIVSNTVYPSPKPSNNNTTSRQSSSIPKPSHNNTTSRQSSSIPKRLTKSAPLFTSGEMINSLNTYVPSRARPATCKDLFYYHSKTNTRQRLGPPDLVLTCMEIDYELHSSVLSRSFKLSELLSHTDKTIAAETIYYKNKFNEPLDKLVKQSGCYGNEGKSSSGVKQSERRDIIHGISHKSHISTQKQAAVTRATMVVPVEQHLSRTGLAIALGNLYCAQFQVEEKDLASVFEAAVYLEFEELICWSEAKMMRTINYHSISAYYIVAKNSGRAELIDSCIRWTELNLIPIMMTKIQLRNLPLSLMETVLKSSRLFTYSEYHVYSCLTLWLFLQMNSIVQLLPAHTNVITYFNSLPKSTSFLEREGQVYIPLFDSLRLHGITDTSQFENIRLMNILTKESMVNLLSEHYSALQSGGDMTLIRKFRFRAVRQGYIINEELPYHCEILSLHGFHFELKTVKKSDSYTFYMQRLKPSDSLLSFRQCERQPFSMRPDRDVMYSITVQTFRDGKQSIVTTDTLRQRFPLTGNNIRSKTLTVTDLCPPFYVTFSVFFPQS